MFRCGICGRQVNRGVPPVPVVTGTHEVQQRDGRVAVGDTYVPLKTVEILREAKACPECALKAKVDGTDLRSTLGGRLPFQPDAVRVRVDVFPAGDEA